MWLLDDQKLRQTLWAEYAELQKKVDRNVSNTLELLRSPWQVEALEDQTAVELQAAIQRIKIVLLAESHGVHRILLRWLWKCPKDPDEFDGQGLA